MDLSIFSVHITPLGSKFHGPDWLRIDVQLCSTGLHGSTEYSRSVRSSRGSTMTPLTSTMTLGFEDYFPEKKLIKVIFGVELSQTLVFFLKIQVRYYLVQVLDLVASGCRSDGQEWWGIASWQNGYPAKRDHICTLCVCASPLQKKHSLFYTSLFETLLY